MFRPKLVVEKLLELEEDYILEKDSMLITLRKGTYIITFEKKSNILGLYGQFDYLYKIRVPTSLGTFVKEVSDETSGEGYIIGKHEIARGILKKSREVPVEKLSEEIIRSIGKKILKFLVENKRIPELAIRLGDSFKAIISREKEVTKIPSASIVRNGRKLVLKTENISLVMNSSNNIVFKSRDGFKLVMTKDNIVSNGLVIKGDKVVSKGLVASNSDLASEKAAEVYSVFVKKLEEDGFILSD